MPIYFDLTSQELPLTTGSIGNRWNQESVKRQNGFPHYHWLQTEHGAGEVVIEEKHLHLTKGSGLLIAPYIPHSYHANEVIWKTSFVTFSGKLEADIHKIVGNDRYIPVAGNTAFSSQGWIDHIISLHETGQINPVQLSIDCYAFLMNVNCSRDYLEQLDHPLYLRYVAPVIKEIETKYNEDITIQNLANTVYVSPQYLSRLFKRFLGCGTYTYLTNYRMSKAKELLANRQDLAISRISFLVGYHDTSHFIAMFKNTTGFTPLEFRQLHH
ncbi:helix-turn-helix transcriptional regulator [Anaerocolumna sp. MB42-C2]|uniref:helix-turn-helix transcriptional regulator n=1 Tax=Anaerocolumna sp. MB42-C2 TaxID=3070997 RepID=UPI0027E1D8FC|nr:AraC family transcriptional regulator [Anaerocolumna sp. MB42-C2]WMJ86272.1 AraC family transcriptional regulator [Anaerocolumna sp. MB42-C2]